MANKSAAAKQHRQSEKRRMRNKVVKSRVHTETKKFYDTLENSDSGPAEEQFKKVTSLIDAAVNKRVFHKNNAARKKSSLHKRLNQFYAAQKK